MRIKPTPTLKLKGSELFGKMVRSRGVSDMERREMDWGGGAEFPVRKWKNQGLKSRKTIEKPKRRDTHRNKDIVCKNAK
jgi:hypothetical protein